MNAKNCLTGAVLNLALLLISFSAASLQAQTPPIIITAAEYYFDGDTNRVFTLPAADGSFDSTDESIAADVIVPSDLTIGPHTIHIRMKSSANVWSITRSQQFVVTGERFITAAEYFFDVDPGAGKGTPLASVDGVWRGAEEALEAAEISTDSLRPGLHTVFVRARDQDNKWGPTRGFTFEVLAAPVVSSMEYLISDINDPSGNWKPLTASAGSAFNASSVDAEASIDTASLSRGIYTLWIRGKDQFGRVTREPSMTRFQVTREAPALATIPNQLLRPGSLLSFKATAGAGANGRFELATGAPSGLTIDPASGLITYSPAANATPASSQVTIIFRDSGTPGFIQSSSFNLTLDPVTGGPVPTLLSAFSLEGGNQVDLVFSRPLDPVSAQQTGSYLVDGKTPASATLRPDGSSVSLKVDGVQGGAFSVNVQGVKDTLGKAITATNLSGRPAGFRSVDFANTTGGQSQGWAFVRGSDSADISAGGAGFTDRSDEGRFVYEEITGDFEIRVQVPRLQTVDYTSAAGLMARESLAPASRSVGVLFRPMGAEPDGTNVITGSRAIGFSRTEPGGSGAVVGGSKASVTHPEGWLRLERQGQTIRGSYGSDGTTWTQVFEVQRALPARLYVGLAAAAGVPSTSSTVLAEFKNYGSTRPAILSSPAAQSVAVGSDVAFGVNARGASPLLYQWFFNDQPMAGETSSLLTLSGVSQDRSGSYKVEVRNAFGLVTSPSAELRVGGAGLPGFEGDVWPRGTGDNAVTVSDWVQVGRYVVGLETLSSTSPEFAKADCAPLRDGGNGVLDVADWAQTARFVIGLDSIRPVARASENSSGGGLAKMAATVRSRSRSLVISSERVRAAGLLELPVLLDCDGTENALGFSLSFDPGGARFKSARIDKGIASGSLQINAKGAAEGRVGLLLGMPAGASIGRGSIRIAWLTFEILNPKTTTYITLGDTPIRRELVDVQVNPLAIISLDGAINPLEQGFAPSILQTAAGDIELGFASEPGREYTVDSTTDLLRWESVGRFKADQIVTRLQLPSTAGSRFYRVRGIE